MPEFHLGITNNIYHARQVASPHTDTESGIKCQCKSQTGNIRHSNFTSFLTHRLAVSKEATSRRTHFNVLSLNGQDAFVFETHLNIDQIPVVGHMRTPTE